MRNKEPYVGNIEDLLVKEEPSTVGWARSFGWALAQLKEGKKLSRSGWNGKDQWVCYMGGTTIPADLINERTKKYVADGQDLKVQGYFVIFTKGTWCPGWLASQGDMLADDWGVVD